MSRATLVLAALLAATSGVAAHAFLDHSSPGAGATLTTAPKEVALQFTESLEPAFSGASVTDAAGQDVTAAPASVEGNKMEIGLKALAPGKYRVAWHAVSVDTHRTEGAFTFVVKQ